MKTQSSLQTGVLEKIKFGLQQDVSGEFLRSMQIEQIRDVISDRMLMRLRCYIRGREVRQQIAASRDVPVTWWDHFKLEIFPAWLLKRFPAKTRRIETIINHYHVCPHLNIASESDHLHFCLADEGRLSCAMPDDHVSQKSCSCRASTAYACATDQRLRDTITCQCRCHR